MSQIAIRLDSETERELEELATQLGVTRAQVVRDAVNLAYRESLRKRLRQEAAVVATDEADRAETAEVLAEMSGHRAW